MNPATVFGVLPDGVRILALLPLEKSFVGRVLLLLRLEVTFNLVDLPGVYVVFWFLAVTTAKKLLAKSFCSV